MHERVVPDLMRHHAVVAGIAGGLEVGHIRNAYGVLQAPPRELDRRGLDRGDASQDAAALLLDGVYQGFALGVRRARIYVHDAGTQTVFASTAGLALHSRV